MGMHNTLYIPKTITVGFQERKDTFTGKLGYVIYTDHAGKLRKESSWQSWRDKKIDSVTVDNDPQNGFTFNKGVQRDRHWGSGRSVIRVWDPRNFEFEISVDNLIGILMHADVSKRDITEPCVFAWNRNELILLPTNSVEYQESIKHTEKQGIKFNTKDLVVGYTYGLKKDSTTRVVYLGYLEQYGVEAINIESNTRYRGHVRTGYACKKKTKKHVFIDEKSHTVETREPKAYIACALTEEVHPEFASLMDKYYTHQQSQPIKGLTIVPCDYRGYNKWYQIGDEFVEIQVQQEWERQVGLSGVVQKMKYIPHVTQYAKYDSETNTVRTSYNENGGYWYDKRIQNNPTSLSENHPKVVALKEQLVRIYSQYPQMSGCNWQDNQQREQTREEIIRQELPGFGQLRYVLADGKTARENTYI